MFASLSCNDPRLARCHTGASHATPPPPPDATDLDAALAEHAAQQRAKAPTALEDMSFGQRMKYEFVNSLKQVRRLLLAAVLRPVGVGSALAAYTIAAASIGCIHWLARLL